MVSEIARNPETAEIPISGIGGVSNWRDAAEFISLGAGNVQVCTAAMLYGFNIVQEMCDGLSDWMDKKGHKSINDFCGAAIPNTTDWKHLNMNYHHIAEIDEDKCIECGRCFAACEDTSHQAISITPREDGTRKFTVIDDECVGCNLCQITCPEPDVITMRKEVNDKPHLSWLHHPANPYREEP
jgi:dihydropyrimidine dehydrogenase (NAD+) subunit PreA